VRFACGFQRGDTGNNDFRITDQLPAQAFNQIA
jgi:hypothetical protein